MRCPYVALSEQNICCSESMSRRVQESCLSMVFENQHHNYLGYNSKCINSFVLFGFFVVVLRDVAVFFVYVWPANAHYPSLSLSFACSVRSIKTIAFHKRRSVFRIERMIKYSMRNLAVVRLRTMAHL